MPLYTAAVILGLVGGLMLLWWSSDKAMHYSLQTAFMFNFSTFFVGFVLVAIATTLPELLIAVSSSIKGVPLLALGNLIGSNFTDVSLVLGLPALITGTIYVPPKQKNSLLFMLGAISFLMGAVFLFEKLTKFHGAFLIAVYIFVISYLWRTRHAEDVMKDKISQARVSLEKERYLQTRQGTVLKFSASLIALMVAAELCVRMGILLAQLMDFPLEVLGVTVFALGSSLPELALNLTSVARGEYSLALGNSLGSVLMQGGFILGLLPLMSDSPIPVYPLRAIAPFMFLSFAIVGFGIYKRNRINRIEGMLLVSLYASFIGYAYLFWIDGWTLF